jgi:hypothetical protein
MFRRIMLVVVVFGALTIQLAAGARTATALEAARSWPLDTTPHVRPVVPDDRSLGKSGAGVATEAAVSRIRKTFITDVNSIDFIDGSEPSIAIDPDDRNETDQIVIHGGFGGWNGSAPLYRSVDGGFTWSRFDSIPPPPGAAGTSGCPCDTTIDFEPGVMEGAFLTFFPTNVFSGSDTNPSLDPVDYFLIGGNAQMTNFFGLGNADQPWLLTNVDPLDDEQNVYVGYDDFNGAPDMRVSVALGGNGNPPDFTLDNKSGASGGGGINPGHRLAVDPRGGNIYSLWQVCVGNCGGDPKTIQFMLNRSTDAGSTWSLNGNAGGIAVATADSHQPTPKFGTVNALLGGIDHAAVDPGSGALYYVYGKIDSGNQRLAIRRIRFVGGNAVIGNEHFVTGPVQAALPSVAVASDGTIGVLYDTFDGFSGGGFPIFTAHFGSSTNRGKTFSDQPLLTFLSPATDNGDPRLRVLGDYQQLKTHGSTFYGAFTGNGAALGRSTASSDPIFVRVRAR